MIAVSAALMLLAQANTSANSLPDDPAANLEALRSLYADSCGARAYAAYDEVCNAITQQIRAAQAELRHHPRPNPPPASAAPPAAPAASSMTPKP